MDLLLKYLVLPETNQRISVTFSWSNRTFKIQISWWCYSKEGLPSDNCALTRAKRKVKWGAPWSAGAQGWRGGSKGEGRRGSEGAGAARRRERGGSTQARRRQRGGAPRPREGGGAARQRERGGTPPPREGGEEDGGGKHPPPPPPTTRCEATESAGSSEQILERENTVIPFHQN